MKKITILFTVLSLVFNVVNGQTIFDFDTNADGSGNNVVTETIDGITVSISDDDAGGNDSAYIVSIGDWNGSSGNVVATGGTNSTTFTFNQAVDVNSILPIDAIGGNVDYTFTPTGGSNAAVVVSLTGGGAPGLVSVDLNWTNVTSFTVTGFADAGMAFDNLSVSASNPPTIVFDFDTNADGSGNNVVTETIDGITVSISDDDAGGNDSAYIVNIGDWNGSSGNVVATGGTNSTTFTFNQAVDVNSILPIDAIGGNVDYTFTPTGGSNAAVVVSLTGGGAPGLVSVDLNWTNVTSFTVTGFADAGMAFDNLSVSSATLSVATKSNGIGTKVYPNPVENILHVKNISDLKFINIYNSLGQFVLQSKRESIDVNHLSKGLYFLQINTSKGVETKRIMKK